MQIQSTPPKPFRWKLLFTWFFVLALLIGSYFIPGTRDFWQNLDEESFFFLNRWIETSRIAQGFWALASHPLADWVEDILIIGLFLLYIREGRDSYEKLRRVAHLFILAITLAVVIKFINQGIFRHLLHFDRKSPSLTLEPVTLLSKQIDWIKVKCKSYTSFPADHATTALLFAGYFCIVSDKALHRVLAVVYAAFLCLPRLVLGAHWITDIIFGAGAIAMIGLTFLFLTPLHSYLERALISLFSLKKKWKRA